MYVYIYTHFLTVPARLHTSTGESLAQAGKIQRIAKPWSLWSYIAGHFTYLFDRGVGGGGFCSPILCT